MHIIGGNYYLVMYLKKNNYIANHVVFINDIGQIFYTKQVLNGRINFYFRYHSQFFFN
jgi:hypothetical protein